MRLSYLLFLLILPLWSEAQFAETIRTGRPGASIGPYTVGKNVFQVQSGVNFARFDHDFSKSNAYRVDAVLRYGVTERIEISGVAAMSRISQSIENFSTSDQQGLSAAQIGVRFNLLNGKGEGLSMGIQSRLKLNVLSEDFEQDRLANTTILILGHPLGNRLSLTANLGFTTPGDPASDPYGGKLTGLYTLNLSAALNRKISVFVENFGTLRQEQWNTQFDTGLGYLVTPDLQLDTSIGYGNNHGVQDVFIDFGFSWRTIGPRE